MPGVMLPSSVRRVEPTDGLPHLMIDSELATAQVFFHGAHIAAWTPEGAAHPVLWLSTRSMFRADKAIRGGVPICFPWFSAHKADPRAPAHGFARLAEWTMIEAAEERGLITLAFELATRPHASPAWPHDARAVFRVAIGGALDMRLQVENIGAGPFTFEEALHTYIAAGDVRQVEITGLEHSDYLDKVEGFARKHQGVQPIRFTGETDRVYLDTTATCRIVDDAWSRTIEVQKSGSRTTVVWNPWAGRAATFSDFGADEWPRMVCVETANVGEAAVRLEPGARHEMSARISLLRT
jgi:glucose-6-phosphate 1-epimerase